MGASKDQKTPGTGRKGRTGNTQKLSIRLLREGLTPDDALRDGVTLADWPKIEGARIALDTMGGGAPKWAKFLELAKNDCDQLTNMTAYGLVFIPSDGRWFAVSFGMGHVKLDPAAFEQDFGLRVVLNAVDPEQLRSADVRTPDENTLSRRSQTSRGSDQTAFAIDVERDIVRGLAGTPKDPAFASYVAGTDGLTMSRKMTVMDLPKACVEAWGVYQKADYKENFGWIDQIRHVRENEKIEKLDAELVKALDQALKGDHTAELHLAFPVIYDPENVSLIRYRGFRSRNRYPDLNISGYLDALKESGKSEYAPEDLASHSVHEVDDEGRDNGNKWKIRECLVFETSLSGHSYVLSGGLWYRVDPALARDVEAFFANAPRVSDLPEAEEGDNEKKYIARIAGNAAGLICLDEKLIRPTGAASNIEVCDFLSKDKHLIHVKDKNSSSRLSHLFNQGTVSARVLKVDAAARDKILAKITEVETNTGKTGFTQVLPASADELRPGEYTVVYAVLETGNKPRLPFFSLVSFRQAARELQALGYKYAFAWIEKPAAGASGKAKRAASKETEVAAAA